MVRGASPRHTVRRRKAFAACVAGVAVLTACDTIDTGDQAPSLAGLVLVEHTGERPLDATELTGKPLLLRFWGTWCGPCRVSMPHWQEMHDRLAFDDIVVLAIANEEPVTIRQYLADHHYTFPAAADPDGRATKAWGIRGIPTECLVDRDGRVVEIGLLDATSVTALLAPMFVSGTTNPAARSDTWPDRMDAAQMRRALAQRAYLAVADALPHAEDDAVVLAQHDPDLPAFSAVWAPREAQLARRAQLAHQQVIGKRAADVDTAMWRELRCNGVLFPMGASRERDPLQGVSLDGHPVLAGDAAAFAQRHMRRALVLQALADGGPLPTDLDAEAARRLAIPPPTTPATRKDR